MSEQASCQLLVALDGEALFREAPPLANERELVKRVEQMAAEHPDAWIMAELRRDDLSYAYCHRPGNNALAHAVFYNDFDDYEDDIELGSERWLRAVLG